MRVSVINRARFSADEHLNHLVRVEGLLRSCNCARKAKEENNQNMSWRLTAFREARPFHEIVSQVFDLRGDVWFSPQAEEINHRPKCALAWSPPLGGFREPILMVGRYIIFNNERMKGLQASPWPGFNKNATPWYAQQRAPRLPLAMWLVRSSTHQSVIKQDRDCPLCP